MDNNEPATRYAQLFGGQPGEPVPEVDPDDVKAVWEYGEETRKTSPGMKGSSIQMFERLCKPGANIRAVCYRAGLLELALMFAKEQLAPMEQQRRFG